MNTPTGNFALIDARTNEHVGLSQFGREAAETAVQTLRLSIDDATAARARLVEVGQPRAAAGYDLVIADMRERLSALLISLRMS